MPGAPEQTFPCKEPGCNGTVTYRRIVQPVFRGMARAPEAPPEGRIIRVYLKCSPNHHQNEYAVRV